MGDINHSAADAAAWEMIRAAYSGVAMIMKALSLPYIICLLDSTMYPADSSALPKIVGFETIAVSLASGAASEWSP